MNGESLQLDDVVFAYPSGPVLINATLEVAQGDFVLLLGPNGSGKSTLIKVALGLLEPQGGRVRLFGIPPDAPAARRKVGYVPQRPAISPRLPATVTEVVATGLVGGGFAGPFRRSDRRAAVDALERVGLADFARRRIGEISGGQQQRALIARALVSRPRMLILDEPAAGVDQMSLSRFSDVLADLYGDGVTILLAAHDTTVVGELMTRVVIVHHGHLDEVAPEEARHHIALGHG